jgi:iron complex outermembrane receptor protein
MKTLMTTWLCLAALAAQASTITDTTTVRLEDVVVTGVRYHTDTRHLPFSLSVVDGQTLRDSREDNILPTLSQQVPSLFVTSRGMLGYGVSTGATGGIKVRGIGQMADLLVLIDGLPQYAGLYGHPIADACQSMLANRVEVVRGPASTIYGSNAMGGVVNIVTRQMPFDGAHTDLTLQGGSYGTFEANAINRFRRGKYSSVVGASYGRTDGHRSNSAFEQTSGFVKLGYDFSPRWALSGYANVTYFESSNPGESTNPLIDNDMLITRGNAAVSLSNDYGHTSGALRVFINWGHHHINDGYHLGQVEPTSFYLHNDLMTGFALYQSYRLFKGNRTTAGIDFTHYGGHAWNRDMTSFEETDITRRSVNEVAGYIDFRQDLTPWLTADAGLRLDHHAVSGNEWVPQGGLTVQLPAEATVRALVSKGFRNPTLRELYMFMPANADLKPVRLMNYEVSYQQQAAALRLSWGVNLFYLKADNMIETRMVSGRPLNVNTGKTENSGVELQAAWAANRHLRLDANYSYLHTSKRQLAAPRHKLYAGAGYRHGDLALHTGLQYVAGLYTTTSNDRHPEEFWLWDVTASYRIAKPVEVFVKGENLLAQRYETVAAFPMPRATVMAGIKCNFK